MVERWARRAGPAIRFRLGAQLGGARYRRLRDDPEAFGLLAFVAARFGVEIGAMVHCSRGEGEVVRARQVAMYLVHTLLQRPFDEAGVVFGRHRSTVGHACAMVEEWRDAPEFDADICWIEDKFRLWRGRRPTQEASHAA